MHAAPAAAALAHAANRLWQSSETRYACNRMCHSNLPASRPRARLPWLPKLWTRGQRCSRIHSHRCCDCQQTAIRTNPNCEEIYNQIRHQAKSSTYDSRANYRQLSHPVARLDMACAVAASARFDDGDAPVLLLVLAMTHLDQVTAAWRRAANAMSCRNTRNEESRADQHMGVLRATGIM